MTGPEDPHDGTASAAGGEHRRVRNVVRVSGRVQGVGFRMAAARQAGRLGVAGTVRNLLDGTVEAVVEGTEQDVEAMVAWLRTGPPSAQVDGVDIRRKEPQGQEGFRVS